MQPGRVDEEQVRILTPQVITVLVRRGADFAAAEDAVQDALLEALRTWPFSPPRDPGAWLVTADGGSSWTPHGPNPPAAVVS